MLKRRSKQAWWWFGRKDTDVGSLRCKIHAIPEPDQLLIDFFNSPEGSQFGNEGNHRGWNPQQTAVHFLKILALDARLVNLERTLAETITDIQTNLDRTQLVVDSLREIAYK